MARIRLLCVLALLLAVVMIPGPAYAEEAAEPVYVENRWNYVDGSIDVSHGIPDDAEGVLAGIRESGVLRVATEPYFPPQEFIDPAFSGQESYVGADMEFARLLARRMGVALEIVPMDFTEVLSAVNDGVCDLAVSALSYTPGRAAISEMSKGYYFSDDNAESVLIIRAADAGTITSAADLQDRDVVAQSGSLQETLMTEKLPNYRQFRRLPQMQDVYRAVENGSADAAMANAEAAAAYIENNPDCGLMLLPGVSYHMQEEFAGDRVAGKKGELQLMYFVNGVIGEMTESGEYYDWYRTAQLRAAELGM